MAAALLFHFGDRELRDVKEAGEVHGHHRRVVSPGVLSERFADKDAGIVDERVDAPEPGHTFRDCTLGRLPIGDVAGDDQNAVIARRLH